MITQKILILGEQTNSLNDLSSSFKKIMPKVFVQSQVSMYRKEILEHRPEVIILDLNMAHSEEAHAILQWVVLNKRDVLVLGISNGQHADLMAHGIELGIEKTFAPPFNIEEISKVITNHFRSQSQYQRPQLPRPLAATVTLEARVIGVDENGIKMVCPHYISKGVSFLFSDELCLEVFQVKSLPMVVVKTYHNGPDYVIYIEPKEPSELTTLALRRFILGH